MRKYVTLAMLCVLLSVFCGAPQEAPKAEEPQTGAKGEVYYAALNEGELQHLIKAIPVFKAEVEKMEGKLESLEGDYDFQSNYRQYASLNQQIPGLDAKLRAAGMAWDQFWPAYGKAALAIGALALDSARAVMQEQMKGQSNEMVQQAMKSFEESSTMYKDVPQVNKDLVKKYWKELTMAFELE